MSHLFCFVVTAIGAASAQGQLAFNVEPINYTTAVATDPVAKLNQKIAAGDATLEHNERDGYLTSLLTHLDIPVASQTLVFSKTSMQKQHISPANPRAIFFNDETYIAWVPGAELIEIASTDPMLGTNFYTIEQHGRPMPARISRRTTRCLFCHASSDTGRIPGLMMQSNYTSDDGYRVFPSRSIRPKATGTLRSRWGGWYVTGTHGKQQHLGNLTIDSTENIKAGDQSPNGNVTDLSKWFDTSKYPSPHSDLVALLVLQHQVTTHNLLTATNHTAKRLIHDASVENKANDRPDGFLTDERKVLLDRLAEKLVDGLLMIGGVEFNEPVSGSSDFADGFSKRGPVDSEGRSLRQLDLKRALFRFPCSYLIYSDSFDALPSPVLERASVRLEAVLNSQDNREKYKHVSAADRQAIREVLAETKPELFDEQGDSGGP